MDVMLSFKEDSAWSPHDLADMKDELKTILGRDADLAEKGAIRNPYHRRSIPVEREAFHAT